MLFPVCIKCMKLEFKIMGLVLPRVCKNLFQTPIPIFTKKTVIKEEAVNMLFWHIDKFAKYQNSSAVYVWLWIPKKRKS